MCADKTYHTALKVLKKLQAAGFTALFAGGCVRDRLLGRTPKDYDIATDARPEAIEALFPRTLALGKAFGVIVVLEDGLQIETATFRSDLGSADGRHPETVAFCAPEEDAKRRDFTVNGLFYDPVTDQLLDFVNGRRDLDAGIIRAIGNPQERFKEDHLRMLRAIRFAGTLAFEIAPQTLQAVRELAPLIRRISAERIEQELTRLLTESVRPGDTLRRLLDCGLLHEILPEVAALDGVEQPPDYHPEGDVFTHTCLMLNQMQAPFPDELEPGPPVENRKELAWALLLHDVGKPDTFSIQPDRKTGLPRIRFFGHDAAGKRIAADVLSRLRFSNREKKHILQAIGNHMRFGAVQHMKKSTLRKLTGAETFPLELELHRLDCASSHRNLDNYRLLTRFLETLRNEPVLPDPWITGRDLIDAGLKPGPRFKQLLNEAYRRQLDGEVPDRAALLAELRKTQGLQ
jgi:poly(A) polymerase